MLAGPAHEAGPKPTNKKVVEASKSETVLSEPFGGGGSRGSACHALRASLLFLPLCPSATLKRPSPAISPALPSDRLPRYNM